MEKVSETFDDKITALSLLVEEIKRVGEVKIEVLADLGEARSYVGCETLFSKHRIIQTTKDDYYLASLLSSSITFNCRSELIDKYCLMVISVSEKEVTVGNQMFFYTISQGKKKPGLVWKTFPMMKHPSLMSTVKEVPKDDSEERQLKRNLKELQEENSDLRKRCRNIEEEYTSLKKHYSDQLQVVEI